MTNLTLVKFTKVTSQFINQKSQIPDKKNQT